jgi:hypothetical protein
MIFNQNQPLSCQSAAPRGGLLKYQLVHWSETNHNNTVITRTFSPSLKVADRYNDRSYHVPGRPDITTGLCDERMKVTENIWELREDVPALSQGQ